MIRIKYLSGMNLSLYMYKSCKQNVIMRKIYCNHGTYAATCTYMYILCIPYVFFISFDLILQLTSRKIKEGFVISSQPMLARFFSPKKQQ